MMNTGKLAGKTIFITGASRGIGKAIALKAARDGANLVIAAKTKDPHPKLPGTIFSAAKEVEEAGGKALPCVVDVRDENQVKEAVENAVKKFGGIDILVNNASAINLSGTLDIDMKRYDLMHTINTRGTFLVSKLCLPYIKKSQNGHILNLSPPINLAPHWFKNHVAYTMAKYGMSMCVLGMAEEFRDDGVAVNALWPRTGMSEEFRDDGVAANVLWPRTAIHTAAIEMLTGADSAKHSRKPEIMADAAYVVLCKDSKSFTGKFLIDDEVLRDAGVTSEQIDQYSCVPGNRDNLMPDFFLDTEIEKIVSKHGTTKQSGFRMFHTSAAARRADDGGVDGVFKAIKSRLNPDIVNSTQAVFQFNLKSGDKEESYFIDLKNGEGSAGKGTPSEAPDATLTMNTENFNKMFEGKLKATSAFMTGKLKISGNMQKAMKLEKLLTSLKSKL